MNKFSLCEFFGSKDLFSESYERVGVMFASIPGFTDYYEKKELIHQDVECLHLLNEIIADFDEVRGFVQHPLSTKCRQSLDKLIVLMANSSSDATNGMYFKCANAHFFIIRYCNSEKFQFQRQA